MLGEPIVYTPATYEFGGYVAEHSWSDQKSYGEVSIRLDWDARLELAFPRTLTQSEAAQLLEQFSEEHLRSRCMRIVLSMPDEILPVVWPQLEEMVNYEWIMLAERQAKRRPAIRESWDALPAPA